MPLGRCGTAAPSARMSCSPPAIAARSSFARSNELASVAFPAISTGVYPLSRRTRRRKLRSPTDVESAAGGAHADPRHLLLLFRGQRRAASGGTGSLWQPLCRLTRAATLPAEFGGVQMNSRRLRRALGCWRADAGGSAAGPRRRHFRYSRRRAFQQGQACEDHRVLQERGGDRQDRRRQRPDPAARQAGLSRNLRRPGRGVQDADHRTRPSSACLR